MAVTRLPENLYALLGVTAVAPDDEIRTAFKRQAKIWHPDKNPASDAADRFRRVREAYEVLACPHRRKAYDERQASRVGQTTRSNPVTAYVRPESNSVQSTNISSNCGLQQRTFGNVIFALSDGAVGVSLNDMKIMAAQVSIPWPQKCTERKELVKELLRSCHDGIDRRVRLGMWSLLSTRDIVYWLDLHGCCLRYALECDTVTKEQVVQLAMTLRAKGSSVTSATTTYIPSSTFTQKIATKTTATVADTSNTTDPPSSRFNFASKQISNPNKIPRGREKAGVGGKKDPPSSGQNTRMPCDTNKRKGSLQSRLRVDLMQVPRGAEWTFFQPPTAASETSCASSAEFAKGNSIERAAGKNGSKRKPAIGRRYGAPKRQKTEQMFGSEDENEAFTEVPVRRSTRCKLNQTKLSRKCEDECAPRRPTSPMVARSKANALNKKKPSSEVPAASPQNAEGPPGVLKTPQICSDRPTDTPLTETPEDANGLLPGGGLRSRLLARMMHAGIASNSAGQPAKPQRGRRNTSRSTSRTSSVESTGSSLDSSSSSASTLPVADPIHIADSGSPRVELVLGCQPKLPGASPAHQSKNRVSAKPFRSSRIPQLGRVCPRLVQKLEDLRGLLEMHRERGDGKDQRILPVLAELETLDSRGEINGIAIRVSRLLLELNSAWWRLESHGSVSQRSAALVLSWIKKDDK